MKEKKPEPKVLVTRELLPEAMEFLRDRAKVEVGAVGRDLSREELLAKIADKTGVLAMLTDVIDREVLDQAPGLKIIANCAVGINNIDIPQARSRGILVTNTPGVLTETTAELALALILAVLRRLPQADRFTREKKFKGWALDLWLGKDLRGARAGIIQAAHDRSVGPGGEDSQQVASAGRWPSARPLSAPRSFIMTRSGSRPTSKDSIKRPIFPWMSCSKLRTSSPSTPD